MTTKISISLPDEDVAYLDSLHAPSRSAAVHQAISHARLGVLEAAYTEAFAEWDATADEAFWSSHDSDGVE